MAGGENYCTYSMPLEIFFSTDEPVSVREIANSLLSLEQLAKRAPHLISEITGVEIGGHQVRVRRIESGSLLEEVVLELLLTPSQRDRLHDYLERHPKVKTTAKLSLGGIALFLIVGQGIQTWNTFTGTNSPHIQDSYNTNITIAADRLDVSSDDLRRMVNNATSQNRKKLVTHSLGMLKPIDGHEDGAVSFGGQEEEIKIPREAMQDIDFETDLDQTSQEIPYEHVQLQVVSLNRENPNGSWTGRLAATIGDTLLKIEIDDGVDIADLSKDEYVYVDATVTYKQDINAASLIPQSILVTGVYDDDRTDIASR